MNPRYLALCVASSCFWVTIAYGIGHTEIPRNLIWAGALAGPFIGITVGELYLIVLGRSRFERAAMALLTLYVAAGLFGLAIGVFDAFQGLDDGSPRDTFAVLLEGVFTTLWGLTFTGYVLLLWPLAYLNHNLVGRLASPPATAK